MKKTIVTGGAGFIGSHLAEELAKRGYHVTVLDDLSTGKLENLSWLMRRPIASEELRDSTSPKNIPPSSPSWERGGGKGVEANFIRGSITNLSLLLKLFRGIDYVFHQAAIPSVPRSTKNPLVCHEANITGTLNVLLAARDNGVKKVIYASSSSVYGDTPNLPKNETMLPNPQSPYAVTKLAGEYYCQVFKQIYDLDTVCLRYFNVYGPRQTPNTQYAAVIPLFIRRLSESKPPIIYGGGNQTRDFTFIRDIIGANIIAAESSAIGIFNIAKGESITINELARLLASLMGRNIEPIHKGPRSGDIRYSLADISRARAIGYEPQYSLEEGLRETISETQGCQID